MADGKNLALGIDVGGTKVLAGVVDENWQIRGRGKVKLSLIHISEPTRPY